MEIDKSSLAIFSGNSHSELACEVAQKLGINLGKVDLKRFPDGEISLRIEESVRGYDVFVVQSIALQPNEFLMELLIMVDALHRASARSITAVIPYFGYSRQDRKDQPRVPITAKLMANLLETAGVSRVLSMDLHAAQVQGFFDVPVDDLQARPSLVEAFQKLRVDNLVVVAPDIGSIKLAREYATQLRVELAIVDKRRVGNESIVAANLIGDVHGKNVLLADDMCTTAKTLVSAAKACQEKGARDIYAAVTHGVFVGEAVQKIEKSPIKQLLVSNTIPMANKLVGTTKITTLSVASSFAQAIRCIVNRESMASLY